MTGNVSSGLFRVCLVAAAGLLFVSCDKDPGPDRRGPTPTPPVARSSGPIAFVSNRDGTDAIYLANEDGSVVTRLTQGLGPAWSKDGGRLAFWRDFNIYVINVDGSGLRWVTHGTYPSWSPDGSRLTLTDGSVFVVDVNGSNRQEIFDDQGYLAFGAVWSPDGRRIAFHVGTFSDIFIEILGLWTVNADGSGAERPLVGAWAPAWSPDSSEIAFVTWSGIGVARADGSGERLPVVAGEIANVDWAPNGNLVYSRWITGSHEGPARIFISDGHERQLIPDASAPARQVYRDFQVAWRR